MKVAIVDYKLGNVFSIQRIIAHLGAEPLITDNHDEILSADRIILPGVGAFGDGMLELQKKKLDNVLYECCSKGKLLLGVCLGMQLLFSESEEFGLHKGLNLISGRVVRFANPSIGGLAYKIPHVGWNRIYLKKKSSKNNGWTDAILSKNSENDFFYFAHSFYAIPKDRECILSFTEYGSMEFCSMVKKDSIYGCQFHPEISGEAGLKIYRQFLFGK